MDEAHAENIRFIESHLIPEMVFNRCFCDAGSREFVEFEAVTIKQLVKNQVNMNRELYKARVLVKFSGDTKLFDVIIKLLPINRQNDNYAYGCFLNEEMFYNKIIAKYKLDIYPKCYVADMGRYGRPVIVLEDLEAIGYHRLHSKLDEDHLRLLVNAIARFHGRGIDLKCNEFSTFREFYAKLNEMSSENPDYLRTISQQLNYLKCMETEFSIKYREKLRNTEIEMEPKKNPFFTICHGDFNLDHSLFLYKDEKPVMVKILGWNKMTYSCLMIDLEEIFIKDIVKKKCISMIHKFFYEYFDTLTRGTRLCRDELLREFLLTIFYPRTLCFMGEVSENERELIKSLDLLE